MSFKKIILGSVLAGAALTASPALPAEKVSNNDFSAVQESTVRVVARSRKGLSYGAGWVLVASNADRNANLGTIVTAYHVVEGARTITIIEPGSNQEITATVRSFDRDRDIAILEVKDLNLPTLQITTVMPANGAPLRTTGYSLASDIADETNVARESQIKSGILSRFFRGSKSIDLIEHDMPIERGFSGGPVVDECARVVAMDLRKGISIPLNDGNIALASGVGYAIASNELSKVLTDEGVEGFSVDTTECVEQGPAPVETSTPIVEADEGESWVETFGMGRLIAAIVLGLGILAALVALVMMRRGREEPEAEEYIDTGSSGETTAAGISAIDITIRDSRGVTLTGTSPDGDPINLQLSAGQLGGDGVMLGRETASGEGLIKDTRGRAFVSRQHASVRFDGSNYTITDNSSANGTYVAAGSGQERKVEAKETETLRDGDTIRLGDVKLNVRINS